MMPPKRTARCALNSVLLRSYDHSRDPVRRFLFREAYKKRVEKNRHFKGEKSGSLYVRIVEGTYLGSLAQPNYSAGIQLEDRQVRLKLYHPSTDTL